MNSNTSTTDELRKAIVKCFYDELVETDHDEWDENSIEYFDTKEVINKIVKLVNKAVIEARIEAIASYKKVNDKLEREIRIDELKQVQLADNLDDNTKDLLWQIYIQDRIKTLKETS